MSRGHSARCITSALVKQLFSYCFGDRTVWSSCVCRCFVESADAQGVYAYEHSSQKHTWLGVNASWVPSWARCINSLSLGFQT